MSTKMNLKNFVVILLSLMVLGCNVAAGRTIYVDDGEPAEFDNIQAAINDANDGDTIVVKDGTYTGDGNRDIDYKGKAITVRSENGPETCIIDCEASPSEHHLGFFFHSGEGPDSVLDGLTITNGCNDDAGAILCTYVSIKDPRGSSPTIVNCVITGNRGTGAFAGAIRCKSHCEPLISDCVISDNIGVAAGGISFADECRPVVSNCIVRGNSGRSAGGIRTGGAHCYGTISNCLINGNSSEEWAGGIEWWSYGGNVDIINCTVADNAGIGGILIGGMGGVTATITNCIVWGNRGETDSAQISLWYMTPEVTYCNVEGGWPGVGNIDADPLFLDADGLDDVIGTEDDDLHLLGSSRCLDVGDNSAVPDSMTTDVEGNPRIMNGTVDMGAYEGPNQGLVVTPRSLTIPEGQTAAFTVALGMDPGGSVEVTVAVESGDPDITVASGATLMFDSSNYSQPQTATLAAAEDEDHLNGTASISVSAAGFSLIAVTATEADNEHVIYVDAGAGFPGADDGSSWADAYRYLQDALAEASSGVQIVVAQGVYKPDEGTYQPPCERTATLQLINGVAIRGGYAGFGAPNPDARDIELYETVLSGDLRGNDTDFNDSDWQHVYDYTSDPSRADNSYSVVTGSGTDSTAILDGFTITGGNANGPILGKCPYLDYRLAAGAGMYNASGSPTVLNCIFRRNTTRSQYACTGNGCTCQADALALAAGGSFYCSCPAVGETCGAGMFNCSSSPTLRNCTFEQNISFGADDFSAGAGMFNVDSNPVLEDCVFSRNLVTGFDNEYAGGAMYNYNSSPTLANCSFIDNVADYSGGGAIENTYNSNATLTECTFIGNTAVRAGGAVNIGESDPVLLNCTFTDNSGYFGGAISIGGHCKPQFINCSFSGNKANEGGAVCTDFHSSARIKNCTFTGNTAREGGAINNSGAWYNDPNSATVIADCTFSGNSAYRGGAMRNAWNRSTTVKNCVFVGNAATVGGGIEYYGCKQDVTNCTFADNSADDGSALACRSQGHPSNVRVANCIIWNGTNAVFNSDNSEIQITFSNVEGGWSGEGNISTDPCFAEPGHWDPNGTLEDPNDDFWVEGDYHLQSQAGRWQPAKQAWVTDDVTSGCIDAGNMSSLIGLEPFPNGGIINMGAYGSTAEASKSHFGEPVCDVIVAGDINGDCKVDWRDLSLMASHWLTNNNP